MELARLQEQFWRGMHAGQPTAGLLLAHPRLQAAEQLEIYADGYRERLSEALAQRYVLTRRLLGEARFAALGAAFLAGHRSRQFAIHRVLDGFISFLADQGLGDRPDVVDLSRLEAARARAMVARDGAAQGLDALGAAAAQLAACRLSFVPHLQHAAVHYDVVGLFAHLASLDDAPVDPAALPASVPIDGDVVAWRRDGTIWHLCLAGPPAVALRAAHQGAPFAALCECFVDAAEPASEALRALGAWFVDGWVAALQPVDDETGR